MSNKPKFYITTAIAYTSRKPHIGNAYDTDGSKNVRIMAGNKSITSAGYTSYRAWCCRRYLRNR